jgi:hypothetical protein
VAARSLFAADVSPDNSDGSVILHALAEAFLPFDRVATTGVTPAQVVQRMELFTSQDQASQSAFSQALSLFNGPHTHDRQTLTFLQMSIDARQQFVQQWAVSEVAEQRRFYRHAKALCMASFYSLDEVWRLIGYDGPILDGQP